MSFADAWKEAIWPWVEETYRKLLKERPAKRGTGTGCNYDDKVYEILETKKQVRNVACNLTWTHPTENTILQSNISFQTVERFALDFFVDTTAGHGQVAGSAATPGAGSAAASAGEDEGEAHTAKVLLQSSKKAWKIPSRVPRGYEIQIAIVTTGTVVTEPTKGNFRRLGLDVVVNATWLAMKWALESGDTVAEAALANLILDWPFDFVLFEGSEPEVQIMKHIINLPVATERLRDFCGLDNGNLMRVAGEVRNLIEGQTPGKVPAAPDVYRWMVNPDNIRWGL